MSSGRTPVTVYLTEDEKLLMEQQASSLNMSLSAYMRWRMNTNGTWTMTNSTTPGVTFTWNPGTSTGTSTGRFRETK